MAASKTCKAKTSGGNSCKARPLKGRPYCFTHDPQNAKARAQARRKGGERTRTPHAGNAEALPAQIRTLGDAQMILDYAMAEVLPMENSIARARVLLALFDSYAESIKIGEFEQRIAALEAMKK